MALKYVVQLLILVSATTGCVSASVFAFFFDISIGIASSAVVLKICAINSRN